MNTLDQFGRWGVDESLFATRQEIVWDTLHNKEGGHTHRDRMACGQEIPLKVHFLLYHALNGHAGGGGGGGGLLRPCTIPTSGSTSLV